MTPDALTGASLTWRLNVRVNAARIFFLRAVFGVSAPCAGPVATMAGAAGVVGGVDAAASLARHGDRLERVRRRLFERHVEPLVASHPEVQPGSC